MFVHFCFLRYFAEIFAAGQLNAPPLVSVFARLSRPFLPLRAPEIAEALYPKNRR